MITTRRFSNLPPEQQAIRAKCFHPSGTFVEFPSEEIEQSITERFEKIVRRHSDRLAVKMGDQALSYEQLNQAANRIARGILDRQGPGQEPVAVLFEQGIEVIAAILGVLKAGKFYVPLSPSLPSARIAAILHDAEAGLLVTDDKSISAAGNAAKNVLNIDEINSTVSNENLSLSVSSDDLAYIIYTSGSTGKPKGVFQKQRNVLQWMLLHTNTLHISPADRLSLTHSHTTSGGIYNLFGALLNGAALFPFDFRTDGEQLASWLRDESITIYHSGPLVFRQWADTLTGADEFPALRLIRLSGMAMAKEDVARYRRHFHQNCLLVHVLGSSEAGTIPHYFIDKHSNVPESPLPVGYSVGDSEVFVLDESGQRAEPEIVGEIAVRSRYLVCGYWRNAALTNEKFLPDPTGGEARLYLTGDSGRMAADGCLYHLGRKDFRVKIRGYSIEIGEIESALREHPAINEVVVIAAADPKGEPQLIAYIVSATGTGVTVSALREHLLGKLPEYMVPSCFVVLPTMPLTPNGKIDRNALPAPPRTRPAQEVPYVAPRTLLEQELKKIWSEVLCLDEIGVHDNFFDLGGHSLRAVQVLTRIRQVSRVAIPLQQFFAAPTLAALANYIEQPRPESGRASIVPLDRVARELALPSSFAQQRLWFLDQLEPGSARYNVALVLQITGRLDVQILQRSFDEILKRHESLRTVFAVNDGQPCQKILPVVTIQLPTVDLTEIGSQASRFRAIEQFIVEEAHRPFDLVCGPLMRCRLLFLDQMQHVLLLTLHHIAFDGWSGAILMRELAVLYAAFSAGKASPLPDLRVQYADYAAWQAASFRGPGTAELLAYWKKQLANLSPLRLPTDRPRRSVPSCRGARKRFSLSTATTQSLNALSRQENATLFMLLLTAFQTLLHRYTGQTDIVTGTPVAGRPHAEVEKLIGFFLNMLALRVDLSGGPTLREALARTRKTCLDAYTHEELPFEILVKELKPERTLDQNPLFQVSFVLQNFPKAPFEATDMTVVEMDIDPGIARFDLHVFMTEEKDRLKGYFEYNTDLFDAATIERMVTHFQTLLEGIVANPEQRISDLPLLNKTERQQLLVEWNDTETDYPKDKAMSTSGRNTLRLPPEQQAIRDKCFHPAGTFVEFPIEDVETSIPERFEKIVRKYPDRLAVKTGSHVVTYAELNAIANRLARAILAKHRNQAEPVGLLFEKGTPLMAAMLGVLKSSRFFVLLDPSFPKSRIAVILQDSQAELVVTNRQNVSLAREVTGGRCQLMEYESIDHAISSENLRLPISSTAFAFVTYTSGSIGQPKGVAQNHRHMLHQVMLRTNFWHVCERDRLSLLASGTSIAVNYTFHALLNGAALFSFDVKKDGVTRLASWLSQERISICGISAPLFRNLVETLTGEEQFTDLRLLQVGSDTIYKSDVDLYKKYFSPDCILATGLSSSEAGLIREYLSDFQTCIDGSEVPVGYPVDGKEILLLDDAGKEIGFNAIGEIAVKSCYISPGYWRKPDLTKAKFLPDPKGSEERLYLTGDLGLMFPDGCLIHKGRKDFRVKVRGYGVEIAEVEKAVLSHPAIREAVVAARENKSGETYLVAYFTSASQLRPTVSELRAFLKTTLPDYMIPSAFLMLDAIPLTPNGKVDRRALPDPKNSRPDINTPLVAPRTSNEEKLAKIWAEVLCVEQIGIHDNFFDLGGHSLLASRVLSRIRDDLQIELSLSRFFETPTVAALAGYIARALATQDRTEALPIRLASRDGRLLLSFTQQRLWFIHQLEPGSTAYNLFSAVRLTGPLNVPALERGINEIIRRHEVLRTVFKTVDGEPLQIILPSMTLKAQVVDLRELVSDTQREFEVRRLSTEEAQRPFDLANGPLLRVTLLRLAADEYVLLLTIHHITFDGWSRGILERELSAIYAAFSSGQAPSLPALPIQYADFAQWQRQRLCGKVVEEQLAYWKKQLEHLPTVELPTDRPRPPVQGTRGGRQSFVLSETLSAGLKSLSNRHGVTLFMTLLAAYQTLLHRYTGQHDIVVGSPVAGRDRTELENLIGFFLNMLVLRTNLSGNPTFRELLSRTREVCLEAYANQDVPFEKLVQELQPQRDVSHNPLFQVTFALQNNPTCPLKLAGLTVEDVDIGSGIAPFDLHLFMVEEERGLRGWLVYKTDLFDASTVERWASHFQTLLEAIVVNPEQRLSEVSLLPEAERHQLLVEWNDTKKDYPKDKCIHQLFEERVEKTPDAVAVIFEEQQLTYRELNTRANQLAHYLRELGVGPETLVGICMDRSLEMIIGLLGILKAGGAYVPLDPAYPKERLGFMLHDSRVAVLLTQKELVGRFGQIQNPKPVVSESEPSKIQNSIVVCLDRDWQEIAKEPQLNPISQNTADSLAYVIYTSGSAGVPKGVEVCHRGVVRLLFGVDYAQLDRTRTFLHLAPISFDASTFEVWGALLHGGKCVLFPGTVPSTKELGEVLKKHQVDTLWLTAALFNLVINEEPHALSEVKQLLIGGEALSVPHVRNALALLPDTKIINGYGPTESTTFACCYPIPHQLDDHLSSIPIGKPIGNTKVYILDSYLNPVPLGVTGELHIGGDGLARGYLNRPELTAENFIANPFSADSTSRLYKTGDLARYLPDGNIEFLGRVDNQVKIRGYRIELGEIEAVLGKHPMVREAVVLAREDSPGDKRLVAYVVIASPHISSASELRSFLQQELPEYMVPPAFVFLESLPLTPNGKLDRKALAAPDQTRPEPDHTYTAPRTPVEELLAQIWSDVLRLDQVGIHDNFFNLGGHSLLATQVMSRIRDAFQIDIPLRALFAKPTVEELAIAVMHGKGERITEKELSTILDDLESLSEDEVKQRLVGGN